MSKSQKKHGISCQGAWLPVPLDFLRSRACAELSPHAAKLLLYLLSRLGTNASGNGDTSLAPKLMVVHGWTSRSTLLAAVQELLDSGLILQTRQGNRLKSSLFAVTLYPLFCDPSKIDVKPGCYGLNDYMGDGAALANPPTESKPARWRQARKSISVTPWRDDTPVLCPATGQQATQEQEKSGTSSRHGTKTPISGNTSSRHGSPLLDSPSPCNVVKGFTSIRTKGVAGHRPRIAMSDCPVDPSPLPDECQPNARPKKKYPCAPNAVESQPAPWEVQDP